MFISIEPIPKALFCSMLFQSWLFLFEVGNSWNQFFYVINCIYLETDFYKNTIWIYNIQNLERNCLRMLYFKITSE